MVKKNINDELKAHIKLYPEEHTTEEFLKYIVMGDNLYNSSCIKIDNFNKALYAVFINHSSQKPKQFERFTHTSKLSNSLDNLYLLDESENNIEYITTSNTNQSNILLKDKSYKRSIILRTKLLENDNRSLLEHLRLRTNESRIFWEKYEYTDIMRMVRIEKDMKKNMKKGKGTTEENEEKKITEELLRKKVEDEKIKNSNKYEEIKIIWEEVCDEIRKMDNIQESLVDSSFFAKQVYFKTNEKNYDILTVLPNISMLIEVSTRLNKLKENKKRIIRHKVQNDHSNNICNLFSIIPLYALIGTSKLIAQKPKKYIINDFFFNYVKYPFLDKDYQKQYITIALCFNKFNNIKEKKILENIFNKIINNIFEERLELMNMKKDNWTEDKNLKISQYQKIWLDDKYISIRKKNKRWLDEIVNDCANWIIYFYNKFANEIHEISYEDKIWIKRLILKRLQEDLYNGC